MTNFAVLARAYLAQPTQPIDGELTPYWYDTSVSPAVWRICIDAVNGSWAAINSPQFAVLLGTQPGADGVATLAPNFPAFPMFMDGGGEGEAGPMGPPGVAGVAGAAGAQGPPGVAGLTMFLDGEPGAEGWPGPAGVAGATGSAGQNGSPGQDGAPGAPGAQGMPGLPIYLLAEAGEEGAMGPPGLTGANGAPGQNGQAGQNGAPGAQGQPGGVVALLDPTNDNEPWPMPTYMPQPVVSVVTAPAMPASTVAVVNKTGVPVTVFLKGGTLTVVTLGGVVTGIAAAAAANTCHIIPLAAGQTIAITYSVAPTWVWVGGL